MLFRSDQRLARDPHDPRALLARATSGGTAAELTSLLTPLIAGDPDPHRCVRAIQLLTENATAIPASLILDALNTAERRFPNTPEIEDAHFAFAEDLATKDPPAGIQALSQLTEHSRLRLQVLEALANATADPLQRRERWLAVAAAAGPSAQGETARSNARDALEEAVLQASDPHAAALLASQQPDGADLPAVLYHRLETTGPSRRPALLALSHQFPSGPWCNEIGRAHV